jgi:hypothetical protein
MRGSVPRATPNDETREPAERPPIGLGLWLEKAKGEQQKDGRVDENEARTRELRCRGSSFVSSRRTVVRSAAVIVAVPPMHEDVDQRTRQKEHVGQRTQNVHAVLVPQKVERDRAE